MIINLRVGPTSCFDIVKEVGRQTGRGEHDAREWGMEDGMAGRWINEGGEAGRGEHGVKEGVKEEGRAGRGK